MKVFGVVLWVPKQIDLFSGFELENGVTEGCI